MSALRDILGEAWRELWRARLRTLLAVGAIAVGALGVSVLAQVQQMMNAEAASGPQAGWLKVEIPRDGDPLREDWRPAAGLRRTRLLPEDAAAIRVQCPRVDSVLVVGGCGAVVDLKVGRVAAKGAVLATGLTTPAQLVAKWVSTSLASGRLFTSEEVARGAHVAIVSAQLKGALSGSSPLLGAQMRVGGVSYRVVGILLPGADHYDSPYVLIPTASARGALTPATWEVFVHAKPADLPQARQQVDAVLKVQLGDPHRSFTASASGVFSTLDRKGLAFFGMIALLVLLSSAVALSNKMYVDVIERLHELALRRAIGLSAARLRATVLCEGVLLCTVGAVLGGGGGWLVIATCLRDWNGRPVPGTGFPLFSVGALLAIAVGLGAAAALHASSVATTVDPAEWLNRKDVV